MLTLERKKYNDYFPEIIGQESIKSKLGFYIKNYSSSYYLPNLLILGQFGSGKTSLCRGMARYLKERDNPNKIKKLIEISGTSLQTEDDIFNILVIPYLKNQFCTLFIDEVHNLDKEAQETLLKILGDIEQSKNRINNYTYNGENYVFDFRKISIIAASTEPQKLLNTLTSRFEVLELDDYTENEIIQIFAKNLKNIHIDNGVFPKLIDSVKNNPREISRLADNICLYMKRENKHTLDSREWGQIYRELQLRPKGLNNIEVKILKILKNNPNSSLTKVASMLQLTPQATRAYHETYLLRLGLLNIKAGSGRSLSHLGHKYLDSIENLS